MPRPSWLFQGRSRLSFQSADGHMKNPGRTGEQDPEPSDSDPAAGASKSAEPPMSTESPASNSWHPLGPHLYRIEDDTLFVRTAGDATLESTILYTDLCRQLIAKNGYVLSLVDLTV